MADDIDKTTGVMITVGHAEAVPVAAALRAVAAERIRQIRLEGWSPAHDDHHDRGELAHAAACYALSSTLKSDGPLPFAFRWITATLTALWPWHESFWKPSDRRRDLVKAAALLLAEIERVDRRDAAERGGR